MRRSKERLNEQIDRLVAGEHDPGDGTELTDFVGLLRSTQTLCPADELVTRLATEAEASSAPERAPARSGQPLLPRWRRRIMLSTFLSTILGKLLVGSVALAATTGGLAATGSLPDPAQAWVAENLSQIGIVIPDPDTESRSGDVLEVIEGTDPADRDDEFGKNVADTASDGTSSDNLDRAEELSDGDGDVADQYVPEEADSANQGADVTDEHVPEEADSANQGADVADEHIPDEADAANDHGGSGRRP